jgi:hypothetical protein
MRPVALRAARKALRRNKGLRSVLKQLDVLCGLAEMLEVTRCCGFSI